MQIEKQVELYQLDQDDIKEYKNKVGIYGLIYDNEVIYVGQSTNIAHRLTKHNSENALESTIKQVIKEDGRSNRCKAIAMYAFIKAHREDMQFVVFQEFEECDADLKTKLNAAEEHFITLFKPKYNYIGVDVPYRSQS